MSDHGGRPRRLGRLLEAAHVYDTRVSRHGETLLLAALLTVGIFLVTPLAGWLLAGVLPARLVLAGVLAVVLAAYAGVALLVGSPALGAGVALVVTSTLAANAPLTGRAGSYPGNLGPQLWVFYAPLAALTVYLLATGPMWSPRPARYDGLLWGLGGWAAVGAVAATPRSPATAAWFAVYVGTLAAVAGVSRLLAERRTLTPTTVATAFLVAVLGHATFALAQFATQSTFGLSFLGETARDPAALGAALSVPGVGTYSYGYLLSGLTGGSGPLASLLVLAIPLAAGRALGPIAAVGGRSRRPRRGRRARGAYAVAAGVCAVALFLTGKQSAYGAALVATGVLCLVRTGLFDRGARQGVVGRVRTAWDAQPRRVGVAAVTGVGAGVAGALGLANHLATSSASLGIRVRQYVGAVRMTLHNPVFGVGGANYPYVAPEYGLPKYLGDGLFPVHSVYLGVSSGTGLPGLALLLGCVAVAASATVAVWRDVPSAATGGAVAGLAGWVALAAFVVAVRYTFVAPVVLLGGVVVGTERRSRTG